MYRSIEWNAGNGAESCENHQETSLVTELATGRTENIRLKHFTATEKC